MACVCRPFRALCSGTHLPSAYALGYCLAPLRGVGQQPLTHWANMLTPLRGYTGGIANSFTAAYLYTPN